MCKKNRVWDGGDGEIRGSLQSSREPRKRSRELERPGSRAGQVGEDEKLQEGVERKQEFGTRAYWGK